VILKITCYEETQCIPLFIGACNRTLNKKLDCGDSEEDVLHHLIGHHVDLV
jgi:hypothetical protein